MTKILDEDWARSPIADPIPPAGAPDVAGLVETLRNKAVIHRDATYTVAADALTAQAAEIAEAQRLISAQQETMAALIAEKDAALAAKEAECDELTSVHADCLLRIAQLESRIRVLEHNLESARAALVGKEPQQP